jgi:hypothetical protein
LLSRDHPSYLIWDAELRASTRSAKVITSRKQKTVHWPKVSSSIWDCWVWWVLRLDGVGIERVRLQVVLVFSCDAVRHGSICLVRSGQGTKASITLRVRIGIYYLFNHKLSIYIMFYASDVQNHVYIYIYICIYIYIYKYFFFIYIYIYIM